MKKHKLASKVSCLTLAVAAANITYAQTPSNSDQHSATNGLTDVQTNEVIQVIGSDEAGFNVAMTSDLIQKRQISDLEDMFRHEPSITVGGGLPVAQKIYVRGLEDTLLNVTIDGATQAGYLYHHQGRVNIEPELIKHVVVKAGAGNATDGAGALGGAIHFTLKDAKDMQQNGQRFGGLIKSAYFSNNHGWKNHLSAYGMFNNDFGLLASVTQFQADENYSDGHGDEVENTEFEQQSVRLKLSGQLSEDHYLGLSYEEYDDDGDRLSRPNMVNIGIHPVYPSTLVPQETHRKSATFNYGYNPDSKLIDLSTTLYYNDHYLTKKGDQYAAVWPPAGPPPTWTYRDYYNGKYHGGGVKSTGLNLRNTSLIGDHAITYGAEYREDSAYLIEAFVSDFDDEETEVKAAYLQADLQLLSNLRLSTGARFDDYDYTDNQGENFSDNAISPNATLSFDASEELELFVGYATAFKGTSSPEVWYLEFPYLNTTLGNYTGADFKSGDVALGEVKAEESNNIELGFKFEGDDFAASGEIYKQTIQNAQITDAATALRYSYTDDVEVEGYALRMAYFWNELTFNLGVSHSKPELDGEPLSSGDMGLGTSYGRTWTTGIEYQMNDALSLGWNGRFVERLTDVPEGQAEKAGYGIHDVYVQWLPMEDLTLGLAVNNLFDKFYFDQGSFFSTSEDADPIGLPEPGRDIRASLAYRF